jgi:hypothetical protein
VTELHDTDLRAVFSDFADTAGRHVRPPGAELAQRKAHVRIRNRRVLVSGGPPWYDSIHILVTMRFDVDGDGTEEIIAKIFCQSSQAGPLQLVAIRPGPNPTILGVVVESADFDGNGRLDPPDGPGIVNIHDYVGLSDGTIRVEVADRFICCGIPVDSALRQERTYAWNGSSFVQMGGPTRFIE